MYLVQTFKIVWLSAIIERISSNCNLTSTCAGSSITNSVFPCKHLQMCNELTRARHNSCYEGQNEISQLTEIKQKKHSLKPRAYTCVFTK